MNKERLLNVAKALRESPAPDNFSMGRIVNDCGTPACALGHYICRNDLQSEFKPRIYSSSYSIGSHYSVSSFSTRDGRLVWYDDYVVADHFQITPAELDALFSPVGCGAANTAVGAAEFIERCVAADAIPLLGGDHD